MNAVPHLRPVALAIGFALLSIGTPVSAEPKRAEAVSLAPIDVQSALTITIRNQDLTTNDRDAVRAYGARLKADASTREVLVIGVATRGEEEKALRHAVSVRDLLVSSSGFSLGSFILQVSTGAPQYDGRVVVQPVRAAPGKIGTARARILQGQDRGNFIVLCDDGDMPVRAVENAGPDDFAAARANCKAASGGNPDSQARSVRVDLGWDATEGKWTLRCADGKPLLRRRTDPDDFYALRRCSH